VINQQMIVSLFVVRFIAAGGGATLHAAS